MTVPAARPAETLAAESPVTEATVIETPRLAKLRVWLPLAAVAPRVSCWLLPAPSDRVRVPAPPALERVYVVDALAPVTTTLWTDVLVPAATTKPAPTVPPVWATERAPVRRF